MMGEIVGRWLSAEVGRSTICETNEFPRQCRYSSSRIVAMIHREECVRDAEKVKFQLVDGIEAAIKEQKHIWGGI
jgi:hypothetical protein